MLYNSNITYNLIDIAGFNRAVGMERLGYVKYLLRREKDSSVRLTYEVYIKKMEEHLASLKYKPVE